VDKRAVWTAWWSKLPEIFIENDQDDKYEDTTCIPDPFSDAVRLDIILCV
jgi:hypothetical protein